MPELVKQLLALPQEERLRIAMTILLSIQEENSGPPDWHDEKLAEFQSKLKEGNVTYYNESEFWAEARKRVS